MNEAIKIVKAKLNEALDKNDAKAVREACIVLQAMERQAGLGKDLTSVLVGILLGTGAMFGLSNLPSSSSTQDGEVVTEEVVNTDETTDGITADYLRMYSEGSDEYNAIEFLTELMQNIRTDTVINEALESLITEDEVSVRNIPEYIWEKIHDRISNFYNEIGTEDQNVKAEIDRAINIAYEECIPELKLKGFDTPEEKLFAIVANDYVNGSKVAGNVSVKSGLAQVVMNDILENIKNNPYFQNIDLDLFFNEGQFDNNVKHLFYELPKIIELDKNYKDLEGTDKEEFDILVQRNFEKALQNLQNETGSIKIAKNIVYRASDKLAAKLFIIAIVGNYSFTGNN